MLAYPAMDAASRDAQIRRVCYAYFARDHVEKVVLGETEISGQFKPDWTASQGQKAAKDFAVSYRPGGVLDEDLKKLLS